MKEIVAENGNDVKCGPQGGACPNVHPRAPSVAPDRWIEALAFHTVMVRSGPLPIRKEGVMADPINTEPIVIESEFGAAEEEFNLNEEWVAYLDSQDPPSIVDGVDTSITYADDGDTAYA
jgi:hypothetical protein